MTNNGDARAELLARLEAGLTLADGIDLDSPDPALMEDGVRRRCTVERKAGGRCKAVVPLDSYLCNAHAQRLDASAGGRATAHTRQKAREAAEDRAALARLGTRAVVAQALSEKAAEVRLTVHRLADLGASGDRQAALALIPWLNQALGMPTERHEVTQPQSASELAGLSDAQLLHLVRGDEKAS